MLEKNKRTGNVRLRATTVTLNWKVQQNVTLFPLNAAAWTDVENSKEEYEEGGPTAGRLEVDNMEEAKLSQKHRIDLELLHATWPATKFKGQKESKMNFKKTETKSLY